MSELLLAVYASDFRGRVRTALGCPSSGLAAIATAWSPEPVLSQFIARPNVLVCASLQLEQDSELMRELGGARRVDR